MRKIVLATIGSLGDLHPFIAIGLALKARGFHVVMAVPEDHVAKSRASGLEAVAIVGGFEAVTTRLGLSDREAARRIMADQTYLMDRVLLPWLSPSAAALDAVMEDAAAIVGSLFVFAAPIIAEKRGLPLATVILQPMALFSAHAPPFTPEFRMMAPAPAGRIGRWWNRGVYAAMRAVLRRRHARDVDAVRAAHGLPPSPDALLLDIPARTRLTLCGYSPVFAPLAPDAPRDAKAVGFPTFDSDSGAAATLDPALVAFLAAGPSPLVFTLGSFAVHAPGGFYDAAIKAARSLGMRAVLLTGAEGDTRSCADLHVARYAPHSLLFPQARAVIHHGGAGSTGQALCAGVPQLVVPHMGDQHDHGRRIAALGVGAVLDAKRFARGQATAAIAALLDERYRIAAKRVGAAIAIETGADTAADAIVAMLDDAAPR